MSHKKPASVPGVYLITNTTNGKVYVGQARNINTRWNHHRHLLDKGTHNNPYLQRAWNKLGAGAFQFTVVVDLSSVPKSQLTEEQNRHEALVFALHPNTYNLLHPGLNGPTVQPETSNKLTAAKKKMWDDLRDDPEKMADMVERVHAWRHTPEGQALQSDWMTSKWQEPEFRATLSKASAAKWTKPGFRENHRAHLQKAWADPEKRAQRIAGLKAGWAKRKARLAAISS
jgi:group I intron endonuclease